MVEIRVTRPEDRRAVAALVSTALLHAPPDDETFERSLASWEDADSLSAFDGDELVGHVSGYRFRTLVPGGAWVPTCGLARVAVRTTAKRRGIGARLVRQLLSEARERGQVLASLRASEAVIYGRFGFGIAGNAGSITFQPDRSGGITGAAPGTMRVLSADEILTVVPPIYDRIACRPGALARAPWMWRRQLGDALAPSGHAQLVAVHTDPGGVDDGYVHYGVKWDEAEWADGGLGEVHELFGADDATELAIWQFLSDVDLIREWKVDDAPLDLPLPLAVSNQRAVRVRDGGWDEQWLRLLDVHAALAARSYAPGREVTIAVDDELFPDNHGVWRVTSDGAERLTGAHPDRADLATDVRALAVAYLGGTTWQALSRVGRVRANADDAAARADALFTVPHRPYCGTFF